MIASRQPPNQHPHQQQAFTLIEVLVVSGITVLLLLATTSLFVSFIIGNTKTNLRHRLKAVGDNAIERMQFVLRNAAQVTSACNQTGTASNSITFTTLDGQSQSLEAQLPDGQSHYRLTLVADGANSYLSPEDIAVQQVEDADADTNLFTCYQNGQAQYVEIDLTLLIGTPDGSDEFDTDSYQQHFHAGVLLRNSGL